MIQGRAMVTVLQRIAQDMIALGWTVKSGDDSPALIGGPGAMHGRDGCTTVSKWQVFSILA
jgi:hypothetical protein